MKRTALLILAILAVTGCESNSYKTYSRKYHVSFSCDINVSPYNLLTTPGQFLAVRLSMADGKLHMVDCNGIKYDQSLSEIQSRQFDLGLAGLILGRPAFDIDSNSIWAFDLGCPDCDEMNVRLSIDNQGTASCNKCNGKWNLNSGGFPISGSSRPLYRYPTMMSSGMLTVSN